MKVLEVSKKEGYTSFMGRVKEAYSNREWVYAIPELENILSSVCENWRNDAFNATHGFEVGSYYYDDTNSDFTKLSQFFACDSEQEVYKKIGTQEYSKGSAFYKFMVESFYGLAMIHEEVQRSFMRAYMLWQHSISVGCAGYSERLQRSLPYYFTYFGSKVLFIDPVKGEVEWLEVWTGTPTSMYIEKYKEYVEVFVEYEKRKRPICRWYREEKKLNFQVKRHKGHSDRKEAERREKRAAGHKVKETTWQTTALGNFEGSAHNIRTHSLICLMVYGLEPMLPALMNSNSIFSVDHISGEHSDNRIDNLRIVSNNDNNSKKGKENYSKFIFDWGLFYLGLPQPKEEEQVQEVEEKKQVEVIGFDWDAELSPLEFASLYGYSVVMG